MVAAYSGSRNGRLSAACPAKPKGWDHLPLPRQRRRTVHSAKANAEGGCSSGCGARDVLILHRRTLHAALPNVGDSVRWSFDLRYMPVGAARGREAFPSFVIRSRKGHGKVVKDPEQWRERWQEARLHLMGGHGPAKNRWSSDATMCAKQGHIGTAGYVVWRPENGQPSDSCRSLVEFVQDAKWSALRLCL